MTKPEKKSKTKTKKTPKKLLVKILSGVLGLVGIAGILGVMYVEYIGRQLNVKTAEQWEDIMTKHPYEHNPSYSRSPCPLLNTLANHGLISRTGRDIAPTELFNALMLLGAPPTVTVGILALVYSKLQTVDPHASFLDQFKPLQKIDLDRLTSYKVLEHDVSLTRNDTYLRPAGTAEIIPELVERMIKLAKFHHPDTTVFTRENEYEARKLRWIESVRDNKHLFFGVFDQFASSTECSLLLDILGREGSISLDHFKSFLMYEKFPKGWYPRDSTYSAYELATKPMICWHGVRSIETSLEILDKLN